MIRSAAMTPSGDPEKKDERCEPLLVEKERLWVLWPTGDRHYAVGAQVVGIFLRHLDLSTRAADDVFDHRTALADDAAHHPVR